MPPDRPGPATRVHRCRIWLAPIHRTAHEVRLPHPVPRAVHTPRVGFGLRSPLGAEEASEIERCHEEEPNKSKWPWGLVIVAKVWKDEKLTPTALESFEHCNPLIAVLDTDHTLQLDQAVAGS